MASKSTGTGSEEPSTPEDNINVVVRVRPLNEKEKRERHGPTLQFPGNGQVIVRELYNFLCINSADPHPISLPDRGQRHGHEAFTQSGQRARLHV